MARLLGIDYGPLTNTATQARCQRRWDAMAEDDRPARYTAALEHFTRERFDEIDDDPELAYEIAGDAGDTDAAIDRHVEQYAREQASLLVYGR